VIHESTYSSSGTPSTSTSSTTYTSTWSYPAPTACTLNKWTTTSSSSSSSTTGTATGSGYRFTPVFVDIRNSTYAFVETYYIYNATLSKDEPQSAKLIVSINGVKNEYPLLVNDGTNDLLGHIIDKTYYYSTNVSPGWAVMSPPNGTLFHQGVFNFRKKNGFKNDEDYYWICGTLASFKVPTNPGYSPWPTSFWWKIPQTSMAFITNGEEGATDFSGPISVQNDANITVTVSSPEVWFPIGVSRK
jgi:hypothetical protein